MLYKDSFIQSRWPDANSEDQDRWFENMRLHGLSYFQQMPTNFTVLDIGCAEGFVSQKFGEWGAKIVHGIDGDSDRILQAQTIQSDTVTYKFQEYDFVTAEKFVYDNEWLLDEYDIILLMSCFHTFNQPIADLLMTLTKTYFVYRGEAANEYKEYLLQNGFQVVLDNDDCPNKIFKK